MGGPPSIVHERLYRLSVEFQNSLYERTNAIRSFLDRSKSGDGGATRELRMRVHRLAGTALTFGYRKLHTVAIDAEIAIEHQLSVYGALNDAGVAAVEKLIALLEQIPSSEVLPELESTDTRADDGGDSSDSLSTGGPPTENGEHLIQRRTIITVGTIEDLPEDFDEQLAVFGMLIVEVDEPRDIRTYLAHSDTDTEAQYGINERCVVFGMVSYFAERSERLKELAHIKDLFPSRVSVVLAGLEDDFQTRLRSVRYGADAFVPIPLDISVLIDKLDSVSRVDTDDPYHVLIVDDDPEQVSDTALILQNAGMITSVVTDPRHIFQVLVEYKPDLILMDMYMPQCTGIELSGVIRQNESFVSIPIVFLSVENNPIEQLSAMQSGAEDFIVKPFDPDKLITSVRIRAARTRAMRFFMERDSLTGLLNHTNLKQRLANELQRAQRIGNKLAFAMIDIDKFKLVNDRYGHLTGDRVLKSLSRLLTERLRRTDIIGRYGGEEFGVILFNTDTDHAERIINEIRESFRTIRQTDGQTEFSVTFSAGLAEFPTFENALTINEAADAALYQAKQQGRNRVAIATVDSAPGT